MVPLLPVEIHVRAYTETDCRSGTKRHCGTDAALPVPDVYAIAICGQCGTTRHWRA
jgi:hypothetical protein